MHKLVSKKQLRKFGFFIGVGLPILVGWIHPAMTGHMFRFWTLLFGISSFLIGILKPQLFFHPYKVSIAITSLTVNILLGLFFLLVLLPISFIMKLFGYDPLKIKTTNSSTYRETRKINSKINLTKLL